MHCWIVKFKVMTTLQFLLFYNLDNGEFSFAISNWSKHELMALDLHNLLPNPDKNEADTDLVYP